MRPSRKLETAKRHPALSIFAYATILIWIFCSIQLASTETSSLKVLAFQSHGALLTSDDSIQDAWDLPYDAVAKTYLKSEKHLNATVLLDGEPVSGATVTFEIYDEGGTAVTLTTPTTDADPNTAGYQMQEWLPGHYGAVFHWDITYVDEKTTVPGPQPGTKWRIKVTASYEGETATQEWWVAVFAINCEPKHGTKTVAAHGDWDGDDIIDGEDTHLKHDGTAAKEHHCSYCHYGTNYAPDKSPGVDYLSGSHREKVGFTCYYGTGTDPKILAPKTGDTYCHGYPEAAGISLPPSEYYPSCSVDPTTIEGVTTSRCHPTIANHTLFTSVYYRPDSHAERAQRPCYYCHGPGDSHNLTQPWSDVVGTKEACLSPDVLSGAKGCHPVVLGLVKYVIPFALPIMGVIIPTSLGDRKVKNGRRSTAPPSKLGDGRLDGNKLLYGIGIACWAIAATLGSIHVLSLTRLNFTWEIPALFAGLLTSLCLYLKVNQERRHNRAQ